jgi:hypothetical protein
MTRNDLYYNTLCEGPGIERGYNVLAENCPDVEFIRVGPILDADIEFYKLFTRYKFITYDEFEEILKTESF